MRVSPIAELSSLRRGGELVAFNVGPDRSAYFTFALAPLDYEFIQPGWAIFPKTVPEQPQRYRVVAVFGGKAVRDVMIEREIFNIHHAQPLGDGLLLACARSHYAGDDNSEKNGRIYSPEGKFIRGILLGDGIRSVQTTSGGTIWTSFFDEGIFGNFGWEDPVGASGLVAWDAVGTKLYEFQSPGELDAISDCYALNVASDEDVWFHYDAKFSLVHLHRRRIESFWEIPVDGSDAFAVSPGYALFRGGHHEPDVYHLLSLGDHGKAKMVDKIELEDEKGGRLIAEQVVGRADALYLIRKQCLYCVDLQDVLAA